MPKAYYRYSIVKTAWGEYIAYGHIYGTTPTRLNEFKTRGEAMQAFPTANVIKVK